MKPCLSNSARTYVNTCRLAPDYPTQSEKIAESRHAPVAGKATRTAFIKPLKGNQSECWDFALIKEARPGAVRPRSRLGQGFKRSAIRPVARLYNTLILQRIVRSRPVSEISLAKAACSGGECDQFERTAISARH